MNELLRDAGDRGRDLRRLVTLSASIYDFGKWTHAPDPERPRHDTPDLWSWRRAGSDGLVFTMLREP